MAPWLQYLIALVVGVHGFVYLGPGSPCRAFRDWSGDSWLLGSAVTGERLEALAMSLHVLAGVVTLGCAVAIGLAPLAPGWWRPLAMVGGAAGIAAFGMFWDGRGRFLFHEGAVGAVLSLILLVGAVMFEEAFR